MSNPLGEKHSLMLAIFLGVTLTFSVFSNAYAASSVSILPLPTRDMKLSSGAATLDDDQDSDNNNGKGKGNKNGNSEDKSDNGNGNKNGHHKLKIKAKHDGGSVEIEEDDDSNGKHSESKTDDSKSFPTNFILEAEGGIAVQKGNKGGDIKRFDDVSIELSASTSRLEGNHIRISVDGTILLGDNEFEITDGHGIIIFFKNPNKHFFRGIVHIAGVAVNVDDESEKKFQLRALLLPSGEDEEGVWSFVVAPAAKLGPDIRIFRLIGELIELGGTTPPPNPKLDHFVVNTISSPVTSGKLFNVTVTAVSSEGKALKNYDGKARISDLSQTVMPETTPRFQDGVFNGNLNITKSMTSDKLTFTDIATNKKGTSNAFNVVHSSLAKIDLTPSAVTIQPAQKANFTAKGLDKFGNEILSSGLTFTWLLSSSDFGSIATSGNHANFTASSTVITETNVTLTARIGTIDDDSKITIQPIASQLLDHFVTNEITGPKKAGSQFSLTLTAVGTTGVTITSYSGPIRLNDTTETMTIVTDNGFSNGVWTGNVKITKVSHNVRITVEDEKTPSKKGTSNAFEVEAGDIDHFQISEIGHQQIAGDDFSMTAKAMDAFGNMITDYNGIVTLSTNDGTSPAGNASSLTPSPYPFNSDDEGQHTFQITLYNAKSGVAITISDSGKNSTTNTFDVIPSSKAKVVISPHSVSVPRGEQLDFKAKAQDGFGNVISGATFSWSLSSLSISIGSLENNSGSVVEFTAAPVVIENITGSITVTSGSISDTATVTVTPS